VNTNSAAEFGNKVIIIIIVFLTPVLNSQGMKKLRYAIQKKYKNQAVVVVSIIIITTAMVILVGSRCPEGNVLGLAFGRRDLYRRRRRWRRRRRRRWLWRVIRAGAAACRVAVLSRRALFTRDLATNDSREHTMHTHLDD